MKSFFHHLLIAGIICTISLLSCKKEKTHLPERELPESLEKQAAGYRSLLTSPQQGWFMLYQPNDSIEAIAIQIKFIDDNTISVLAGWRNYHEESGALSYSFDGEYTLQIVFPENSVFGEITNELNGFNKFKIYLQDNGDFHLKRADGFDGKTIVLTQLNQENQLTLNHQIQLILDEIAYEEEMERLSTEAKEKLAAFISADPGYYFNNLMLENVGASFDHIDTANRKVTFSWRPNGATKQQQTFSYRIIPGGLLLQPSLVSGTYVIDTLQFGTFEDHKLQIISAGNAGQGHLGWMHTPPFEYQTAWTGPSETYTTADYFVRKEELPRFFGYTLDAVDLYYSEMLQPHLETLRSYFISQGFKADELLRLQFYNNNHGSSFPDTHERRNQLQVFTRNAAGTNVWLVFYNDVEKVSANHVRLQSFGTANTAGAPHVEKVFEFMNTIFTEEGVTVVPAGRSGTGSTATQIIRLVSRKDSRYWVQLVVSNFTPSIYFD
jgi:hypothetical protein